MQRYAFLHIKSIFKFPLFQINYSSQKLKKKPVLMTLKFNLMLYYQFENEDF